MMTQRGLVAFVVTGVVALIVSLPASAQQLPQGFRSRDVGAPGVPGTARFDNGKFTLQGSGADLFGSNDDHFQFVSQEVTGDGTIVARIVSATGVADSGGQKNGVMIRENDTPGSPHATTYMSKRGSGAYFMWREAQDGDTQEISGFAPPVVPIWLRTQRVGNEFSGYVSYDGQLWIYTSTQNVSMAEKANFGIHVMSHDDGKLDTVEFDNVAALPGVTAVAGVQACGSENGVLLQWKPLKGAQSYNLYRGPESLEISAVKLEQLQKINADTVSQASFTDNSGDLKPGARYVYAVAAVTNGQEGARVAVLAGKPGPSTPPAGFNYTVIGDNNEGECALGSTGVAVDANGVITMRSGGHDIWDDGDDCTFLHQKVSGDFRITVAMLRLPSATSSWAKAGPMVRESVDRGSRQVLFAALGLEGAVVSWRTETDGGSASTDSEGNGRALDWNTARDAVAKAPLYLRLTRQGDKITPEYSLDGTTFQPGSDPITVSGLKTELEVGVAHTSHDATRVSEVKFRDVKIEKL
jgi:regulation of enolase protein 1 (concanavalin A-like superfamily)